MMFPVINLNGLLLVDDLEGEDLLLKRDLLLDRRREGEDLHLEDVLNETLDLDDLEQEMM
jgi:hypothetical protein